MVLYALRRLNFPLKVEIVTNIIHFTDDLCNFTSVFNECVLLKCIQFREINQIAEKLSLNTLNSHLKFEGNLNLLNSFQHGGYSCLAQ